jgi:phage baseplate assembly protein W
MSTNRTSDFNAAPNRVARKVLWADLDLAFVLHPSLNDIRPVIDLEAVKASVKNLVLTSRFERPFHPEIGGNVYRLLFEPADVFTALSLKQEIEDVIVRFEPRALSPEVSVLDDSERNAFLISITFGVSSSLSSTVSVSFYLTRLR